MKIRALLPLSLLLVCFGSRSALSSAIGDSTKISGNSRPWVSFSDLPIHLPDSSIGGFVGGFQDELIVSGGRDDAIYFRDRRSNDTSPWQSFKARDARALGCSAIWKENLICIGGLDAKGPSRSVTRIFFADGAAHEEPMPELPFPLVGAGAAVMNDSLFVFGGARGPSGGDLSGELLKLDLDSPNAGWTTQATLPAEGRFMATVCAEGGQINIFGGCHRDSPSGDFTPSDDAWAYRTVPVDGTRVTGWVRLAAIPFPVAGAAAWPTGQSNIMVCGGASAGGSFTQLTTGIPRGLNHQLLAYNTVTDSFANVGTWERPLFGATQVSWDSRVVLAGGRDETGAASNLIEMKLQSQVRRLSYLDYGAIAVYFALFTLVGALFARKQTSSDTFALGGRSVKWWLAGISLYATGTSAISYMAIPAQTFSTNIIWWILPVPLAALALLPQAYLVIPLIRRLNVTSTYEYLERRFNPALRLLASAQCIVFQIAGRMAVVMLLPAMAISAVTGISLLAAVLIMGVITTIYTAIGGIDAVIWTDAIQTILTIGGPLLALVIIFTSFDGHPTEVFTIAAKYSKFKLFLFDWNFTLPVFWIAVISTIFSVVGFAGDQTMVQRVLCTSSVREARRATLTLFVFVAIGATLFHFLGIAAFSYFRASERSGSEDGQRSDRSAVHRSEDADRHRRADHREHFRRVDVNTLGNDQQRGHADLGGFLQTHPPRRDGSATPSAHENHQLRGGNPEHVDRLLHGDVQFPVGVRNLEQTDRAARRRICRRLHTWNVHYASQCRRSDHWSRVQPAVHSFHQGIHAASLDALRAGGDRQLRDRGISREFSFPAYVEEPGGLDGLHRAPCSRCRGE